MILTHLALFSFFGDAGSVVAKTYQGVQIATETISIPTVADETLTTPTITNEAIE
jgi:hypothetical protein